MTTPLKKEQISINVQEYKKVGFKKFSKIHQMTAYLAMFPPSLPNYFIQKFSKKGDLVFDPFSGRGTTAFEACRLGRIGIGNDLNPLAICLTRAKTNIPLNKKTIHRRINILEANYRPQDTSNVAFDIKILYDEKTTLSQLLYLKQQLNKRLKVDAFILAVLTGIMHGKQRKDGTSIYCSIDMPNTFSMSPNYIKKFVEEHSLTKPKQNVFNLIRNRVDSLLKELNNENHQQDPLKTLKDYTRGYCFETDAIKSSKKVKAKFGQNSVQLIVTSPPYLKVINYGKFNWIRLWLLDEDSKKVDSSVGIYHKVQKQNLSDKMPLLQYAKYMQELFNSWDEILSDDGYAFVVIGDVLEKSKSGEALNLANETWNIIEHHGGCKLELVDIVEDVLLENQRGETKVTKIWGKTKGNATSIDRIMILRRRKVL